MIQLRNLKHNEQCQVHAQKKQMATRKLELIVVMFDGRPCFLISFFPLRSGTGVHWISLIVYYKGKKQFLGMFF